MVQNSSLQERIDGASSFEEAVRIVEGAACFPRQEALKLIHDLYEEYIGPDETGGGDAGNLKHLRKLVESINPTDQEIKDLGMHHLRSYLAHD
ncbi:MAG: hypothetical protein A3H57_01795 [Candidatus Taylorbacteria bacterium RIFCSPLOWO2_02_FULL_43_11]|nr:MAG: hypothetical protein A2743_00415 [Candidatus Taylorbacteria bacterium RIFCSPHIGHO2_01_FULL_43_47]OHA30922.1 MAG: hypothetical protein A3B08_03930 [Candidatus Taylorbacteria bacterium RIFCSPLOWO2_01_FULL_43_44]OHA37610.1 MAG: hypothetical protein A3H57_01795 [Candidatus Taylorbacteria bacterium RIFCSPLOWO2_02_FULL_43_11]